MMIKIIGATHPGRREHNEDCFVVDVDLGFGLVADGMGGYACGEVASELVKDTMLLAISAGDDLNNAIVKSHIAVEKTAAEDQTKQGMGSTALAVKFDKQDYEIVWVGDSRAYLWDETFQTLTQITRDHSYIEALLSTGEISDKEALTHPNRNLITQAIGVAGDDGLDIGLVKGRLGRGQKLLLCSDGLVDEVSDLSIANKITTFASLENTVDSLVEAAVNAGGHDNITVVMAEIDTDITNHVIDDALNPDAIRSISLNYDNEESTEPRPDSELNRSNHKMNKPVTAGDSAFNISILLHNIIGSNITLAILFAFVMIVLINLI